MKFLFAVFIVFFIYNLANGFLIPTLLSLVWIVLIGFAIKKFNGT